MKTSKKAILNAVKAVVAMKEKQNDELYRSPVFFHQPKRPQK